MISLKNLSKTHCEEIAQIEDGIRGDADSILWTTSLRASTRGGKKMITLIADEAADNCGVSSR